MEIGETACVCVNVLRVVGNSRRRRRRRRQQGEVRAEEANVIITFVANARLTVLANWSLLRVGVCARRFGIYTQKYTNIVHEGPVHEIYSTICIYAHERRIYYNSINPCSPSLSLTLSVHHIP